MPENPPPDFENPPVVEVVCGIQFEYLSQLITPHFGLLWEMYKLVCFGKCINLNIPIARK